MTDTLTSYQPTTPASGILNIAFANITGSGGGVFLFAATAVSVQIVLFNRTLLSISSNLSFEMFCAKTRIYRLTVPASGTPVATQIIGTGASGTGTLGSVVDMKWDGVNKQLYAVDLSKVRRSQTVYCSFFFRFHM